MSEFSLLTRTRCAMELRVLQTEPLVSTIEIGACRGEVGALPEDKVDFDAMTEAKAEVWEHMIQASLRMAEKPLELDARTTEIIAAHFSLEREIELALERLVARPRELDRLGFGHKVAVLKALFEGPIVDKVAAMLLAFNELRNAAAHPRNPDLRPLIQKLHSLLEDDELSWEDDDIVPSGETPILLSPEDTPIVAYAAAIAGALQAVVGLAVIARAVAP